MTPDEQHEKYYRDNPNGNHSEPSPETLRFMSEQIEINKKNIEDHAEIKETLVRILTMSGAIHEQTLKTNGRVNKLDTYLPMLEDIKDERKTLKNQLFNWGWKILLLVVLGSIGIQNVEKIISVLK